MTTVRTPPARTAAELVDAAHAVAAELTRTAVERDRELRAPHAEVDQLRHAGLLTALHPTDVGGAGLDLRQGLELVRIVSGGDTSIGQLLGYHYINIHFPRLLRSERLADLEQRTVTDSLYWGAVVNQREPNPVLTRTDDGYRLDGRRSFSTGARVADLLIVSASLDDRPVFLAVPSDRPGYTANDDWDNIGQRLSDSGSVLFDGFPVTDDDFLAPPVTAEPPPSFTIHTPLVQLVFVTLYLGTAQAALDAAVDYVRTTTRAWPTSGVDRAGDDPYILHTIGTLKTELDASQALTDRATGFLLDALARGTDLTADERADAAVAIYEAKVHSTKVSLDVTSRLFELAGARASASKYGFDRFWRNVRTHTLHDPVSYKAREVGDRLVNGTAPVPSLYS